jgi:hypothetical protein
VFADTGLEFQAIWGISGTMNCTSRAKLLEGREAWLKAAVPDVGIIPLEELGWNLLVRAITELWEERTT